MQGFDFAQSLAGGIDAWSRTIDPTVPRYYCEHKRATPSAPSFDWLEWRG
jgi:hypothetical protein